MHTHIHTHTPTHTHARTCTHTHAHARTHTHTHTHTQPPPAESLLQALELLYALGGKGVCMHMKEGVSTREKASPSWSLPLLQPWMMAVSSLSLWDSGWPSSPSPPCLQKCCSCQVGTLYMAHVDCVKEQHTVPYSPHPPTRTPTRYI